LLYHTKKNRIFVKSKGQDDKATQRSDGKENVPQLPNEKPHKL